LQFSVKRQLDRVAKRPRNIQDLPLTRRVIIQRAMRIENRIGEAATITFLEFFTQQNSSRSNLTDGIPLRMSGSVMPDPHPKYER
jgi:hypothetical protein